MITSTSNLNALPPRTTVSLNPSWKLGDIMQGRVVGNGKGNAIVNIRGNNYWLNSPLQFSQGESLMLKVAGLTPMVHFTLVNRIRKNVGNSEVMSMNATDKILQSSNNADRGMNSSLTSLISLLHFGSTQALPQATLELIDSLRRRLLRSSGLMNPSLIRHSILNGSLVSSRHGAAGTAQPAESGLQLLLAQIVDSLAVHKDAVGKFPVVGNYKHALGISLYQSSDGDVLKSFTRSVEEHYQNLCNSKPKPQEEMLMQPYRLAVELPILFKEQIRSLTIRFDDRKRREKQNSNDDACSAEFELELGSCGFVYARISIENMKASFLVGCEQERVAVHLGRCEKAITEALDVYGLMLEEFRCDIKNGHLSLEPVPRKKSQNGMLEKAIDRGAQRTPIQTEESLRQKMHEAHDQGQVPELDQFTLQLNNKKAPAGTNIPVELYCAMSSLFVQLLEVD